MYANIKASNIRRDLEDKMTVVGYCRLSRDVYKRQILNLNLSKEENARFKNSCNVLNEMKNEIFSNEDIKM